MQIQILTSKKYNMYKYILVIASVFVMFSCKKYKSANISIQNNVHNVKLTNISWGDYYLSDVLLPGVTSDKYYIEDEDDFWPKTNNVEFYMEKGLNRVYLKTKYKFTLNSDDDITIIISDTTSVVNPILQ